MCVCVCVCSRAFEQSEIREQKKDEIKIKSFCVWCAFCSTFASSVENKDCVARPMQNDALAHWQMITILNEMSNSNDFIRRNSNAHRKSKLLVRAPFERAVVGIICAHKR